MHSYSWNAQVELNTFSSSLRVLPRSVYSLHQFKFAGYKTQHDFRRGDLDPACRMSIKRKEVEVSAADPAAISEPIQSAMHTILDSDLPLSPISLVPSLANGGAGKQIRWHDTVPVRAIVSPVRRELGYTMARWSEQSTPLSFEDSVVLHSSLDDDLPSLQVSGHSSTPVSSDRDEADDYWGLSAISPAASPLTARPTDNNDDQPLEPFTLDDFEDPIPSLLEQEHQGRMISRRKPVLGPTSTSNAAAAKTSVSTSESITEATASRLPSKRTSTDKAETGSPLLQSSKPDSPPVAATSTSKEERSSAAATTSSKPAKKAIPSSSTSTTKPKSITSKVEMTRSRSKGSS